MNESRSENHTAALVFESLLYYINAMLLLHWNRTKMAIKPLIVEHFNWQLYVTFSSFAFVSIPINLKKLAQNLSCKSLNLNLQADLSSVFEIMVQE